MFHFFVRWRSRAQGYYKRQSRSHPVNSPEVQAGIAGSAFDSGKRRRDNHGVSGNRMLRWILNLALAALILFAPAAQAQQAPKRLILKDGSYQLADKWETKGDRIRYYSSEREDWEELPNALVDWPATEKYEKDRQAAASSPEAIALDKEIAEEDARADAKLPEVAPGLRIPEDNGVFLLDNFQGEPQIVELQQSAGDVNRNTKGNIFRGAINPIASMKQTIELDGAHAKMQAHVDVPSIYINVDAAPDSMMQSSKGNSKQSSSPSANSSSGAQQPQQAEQAQQPQQAVVPFDQFRLVRMDVKGNKRIVGSVKRQITGKVSEDQHLVKTTTTPVTGGWLKLTPTETMTPGEYAVVEMLPQEGMNLDVWDFGVNPKAPANANPWKPDKKPPAPAPKTNP